MESSALWGNLSRSIICFSFFRNIFLEGNSRAIRWQEKKLGYFPLPVEHGPRIRARLSFPDQTVNALDPCAGTGAALKAITADSGAELFGIELDANRAADASRLGLRVIHGNVFDVRARVERLFPALSQSAV